MTADNLESLTTAQLGEVFAVELDGWAACEKWPDLIVKPGGSSAVYKSQIPPFSTSADAVMPYLAKFRWSCDHWPKGRASCEPSDYVVSINGRHYEGSAPTFAAAACIALIRAARAQKASAK